MSVVIALFTRDLRVHDNPVLHAACHAATEVVPLFVLDTAIFTRSPVNGSASPNRAVFLAEALADLDAHLGVGEVHLAADVSGYSNRREQALRERLASHGCTVRFHANTITVVEPGAITPETPGGEAFIRQLAWRDFHHQVLAAPDPTGSSILSGRPNATTPTGDYVRRYLPELQDIPGPAVHQPWKLDLHHRARLHYPDPIIDLRDGADYFRTAREKAATMASVEPGGEQ